MSGLRFIFLKEIAGLQELSQQPIHQFWWRQTAGNLVERAGVPVRTSVSGTVAERRARCPRGNARV